MEQNRILASGDLQISCKFSQPEDGQIRRLVMGVHGLCGSASEDIQAAIAEEMEMFYAAVLRFDFPAHGDSPMGSEAFTLQNCRDTLLAAAKWLRGEFPQVEDLCIFATGFGAYITLLELENLIAMPGKVKLVVQTPSVMFHESMLAMKGITRPTLEALGKITYKLERPLEVRYQFYEEARENIVLTTQPIPMLILHGEEDAFIPMEYIRHFRRINEGSPLVIIPGASHRFLESGAWDMVLDLTRDWFEFEQVLCCDWE